MVLRRSWLAALPAALALALAACGSDDSSSTSSSSTSSGGGAASTQAASSAGSDTTASSGAGLKDPGKRTIGVIPITATSENLGVWSAQIKAAAEPFGWKVNVCDGAGNVATVERCGQTFVTQKVAAIVTMAIGGPEIPSTFKQAKAAKIPVLAFGTSVNPGYEKVYDGVFGDEIVKMGEITGKWLADNRPDDPILGMDVSAAYGGHGYVVGVKKALAENNLKYTDIRDTNLADIVNSMKSTSQAIIRAHPGKASFVTFNDIDASLYWSDIVKLGRDKDVTMITRYDDPSTVKLMKSGANILVSNTKEAQHAFDMMTALAAYYTDGTPLPDPATTTNTPSAGIYSIKDFPAGSPRQFPFDPALKAQIPIWAKTYKLQPSTLHAP